MCPLCEVKVPSALTKTRQAGQGSTAHGGCCASLGHKFGFGAPSTKPCSRLLGAKSAATSHRARSSMRPAKAGSKSTRDCKFDNHTEKCPIAIRLSHIHLFHMCVLSLATVSHSLPLCAGSESTAHTLTPDLPLTSHLTTPGGEGHRDHGTDALSAHVSHDCH